MGWGVFFGGDMLAEYHVFYRVSNGPVKGSRIYTWAWEKDLTSLEVASKIASKEQVYVNQIELFGIQKKEDLWDCLKSLGLR
jgi:hypothetical protein